MYLLTAGLQYQYDLYHVFALFLDLNSREERSRQYFDTVLDLDTSEKTAADLEWGGLTSEAENIDRQFSYSTMGGIKSQTQAQLLLLEEENTRMAAHREAEVQGIVKSIVDLNDIFKDLAHMVVEQVYNFIMYTYSKNNQF